VRLVFSQRVPHFTRLLLVESGSRVLLDNLVPGLRELYPKLEIDLVTCFQGEPAGFPSTGQVWRVYEYPDKASRARLLAELKARHYPMVGIICSGEPIMTKWKWWLAARMAAKLFVLNENGDYFWFHYTNWRMMLHFILFRAGLTGGDTVTTITRLLLFPFLFVYLLSYAAAVHLRRRLRT
jgi:hypothetical protein